jgi:GNAT superfamily N-acetyltransferase
VSDARFTVLRLNAQHNRSDFSCGEPSLDRYLHQQASQDVRRRISAVYVLLDHQESLIAGYYTLSATSIQFPDLPETETRRLPRYQTLPACLLGRLAVDQRYAGQGMGRRLMLDAIRRATEMTSSLGMVAIIVDAIDDDAVSFYQHFGFRRFPTELSRRMFLSMSDARELLN